VHGELSHRVAIPAYGAPAQEVYSALPSNLCRHACIILQCIFTAVAAVVVCMRFPHTSCPTHYQLFAFKTAYASKGLLVQSHWSESTLR